MRHRVVLAILLAGLCLKAYEPPVDTAGPLTVRIQAPAAVYWKRGIP